MRTEQEYKVALQNNRILYTKIKILNFRFQTVEEIEGIVLDGATFSNNSTSNIRRTCNLTLLPSDNKKYSIEVNSNVWIDKYVKIYIGVEDQETKEVVYTNMGVYLIDNPSSVYSAVDNTLTINGVDLMSRLTGDRNGYLVNLEGVGYKVPKGSSIKGAMIAILKEFHFDKWVIEDPVSVQGNVTATPYTPNEILISVGGTAYQLLEQLADINSNYQMYFDVDGVFRYEMIPSGKNEPVRVDDKLWDKVVISLNTNIDYSSVKNYVEVYGKTNDKGDTPYGLAYDDNPESPFCINGTCGVISQVFTGGEYDNIQASVDAPTDAPFNKYSERKHMPEWYEFDSLAQQRADYELYIRCRLQDKITINCVPVYWLDTNWLVEITVPNSGTQLYLIKSIDTTLGENGTQTVSLMRYYPYYPFY